MGSTPLGLLYPREEHEKQSRELLEKWVSYCATLQEVNRDRSDRVIHGDLPCVELNGHEKTQKFSIPASIGNQAGSEPQMAEGLRSEALRTVDDAIRLAIKLAVDAGDYERAAALLEIAKRGPTSAVSDAPTASAARQEPTPK